MQKTLFLILAILLVLAFSIYGLVINSNSEKRVIIKENKEYEKYLNKEIIGTELTTLINKVIDKNEKNKIPKDENGYYIENGENSIKIEVKMTTIDKMYPMEEFYNNDITKFVQNFNLEDFKCTNIEYHKKTGKVSKLIFEQI